VILNHDPRKISLTNGNEGNGTGLKKEKRKKKKKRTKSNKANKRDSKLVMKFVFCQYFL